MKPEKRPRRVKTVPVVVRGCILHLTPARAKEAREQESRMMQADLAANRAD